MPIERVLLRSPQGEGGTTILPTWTEFDMWTPDTPPPVDPPPSADAFDFTQAAQHEGPVFTSWPATAKITQLDITSRGIHVEFTKKDTWPNVRPLGWDGDLQYSLGMAMFIDSKWHVSAPIQFWHELEFSGGNIAETFGSIGQINKNWFYSPARWGAMCRQPATGEMVGFFVVAGSVRAGSEAVKVQERSNVVVVPFPTTAGAKYTI